jgi:hypothetical protein
VSAVHGMLRTCPGTRAPRRRTMKFSEWLNQQDIELAHWEPRSLPDHHHDLVPFEPEETDAILERYLRNVRMIYGPPIAGADHLCIFNCPYPHPEASKDAAEIARNRLEEIRALRKKE